MQIGGPTPAVQALYSPIERAGASGSRGNQHGRRGVLANLLVVDRHEQIDASLMSQPSLARIVSLFWLPRSLPFGSRLNSPSS